MSAGSRGTHIQAQRRQDQLRRRGSVRGCPGGVSAFLCHADDAMSAPCLPLLRRWRDLNHEAIEGEGSSARHGKEGVGGGLKRGVARRSSSAWRSAFSCDARATAAATAPSHSSRAVLASSQGCALARSQPCDMARWNSSGQSASAESSNPCTTSSHARATRDSQGMDCVSLRTKRPNAAPTASSAHVPLGSSPPPCTPAATLRSDSHEMKAWHFQMQIPLIPRRALRCPTCHPLGTIHVSNWPRAVHATHLWPISNSVNAAIVHAGSPSSSPRVRCSLPQLQGIALIRLVPCRSAVHPADSAQR